MQLLSMDIIQSLPILATAATCRLPVSELVIDIRHPTGREDMLLFETTSNDARLALVLAEYLARAADGRSVEWRSLSVTDLDVFIVRLRQHLMGDRIRADVKCRAPNCGKRIDVDFSIDAYLHHHLPNRSKLRLRGWSVKPADDEPGWFCLAPRPSGKRGSPVASQVQFRLPTVGDLLAVGRFLDADEELARLCIRPAELPSRLRHPVEVGHGSNGPQPLRRFGGNLPGMWGARSNSFRCQAILPPGAARPVCLPL